MPKTKLASAPSSCSDKDKIKKPKMNEKASSVSLDTAAQPSQKASHPRKKASDKRDEDDVPRILIEGNKTIQNDNAGYAYIIQQCIGPGGCGWHRYRERSKSLADDNYIYIRPGHEDINSAKKIRASKLVNNQDFFVGDEALYKYIMPLVLRKNSNI